MSQSSKRQQAKAQRRKARITRGKSKNQRGLPAHRRRPAPVDPMSQMPPSLLHSAGLEHNADACPECRRERANA